jgi:hypothetical protein
MDEYALIGRITVAGEENRNITVDERFFENVAEFIYTDFFIPIIYLG